MMLSAAERKSQWIAMVMALIGIGLASYLLSRINFLLSRLQANEAALKAMLVNKIGDFGLAI
jgi:NADH:ubiquinone oxidoreductase subunit 5 (subunit L)/multisubunit Na+/H+ antiporter MnhA subunit